MSGIDESPETAERTAYTAEVDREDDWWTIHVLELDVVTQAAHWSEVEVMARGVIAAMLDREDDGLLLEIVPVFDDEAGRLLREAEGLEAQARDLAASAGSAKRLAVRSLKAAGWTLQAIATGLGLSHQRIEQLLKDEPDGNASVRHQRRAGAGSATVRQHRSLRTAVTGRYVTRSTARRNPGAASGNRRAGS